MFIPSKLRGRRQIRIELAQGLYLQGMSLFRPTDCCDLTELQSLQHVRSTERYHIILCLSCR